MKRLLPKLWAKLTAIFLLLAMTLLTLASGAGVGVMIYENAYVDDGARLRKDLFSSLVNERIEEAVQYLTANLSQDTGDVRISDDFTARFGEENTNFFFTVTTTDGTLLLQNYAESAGQYTVTKDDCPILLDSLSVSERKTFSSAAERQVYLEQLQNGGNAILSESTFETENGESGLDVVYAPQSTIRVTAGLRTDLTAKDEFYTADYWLTRLLNARGTLLAVGILSLLCGLFLLIFLLCAAGHREGAEGIVLSWADRIPLDLYLALLAALGVCIAQPLQESLFSSAAGYVSYGLFAGLFCLLLALALLLSFAVRAKAGAWWRNTIVFRVLRLLWHLLRSLWQGAAALLKGLPLYWQFGLAWAGLSLLEFLFLVSGQHAFAVFWAAEKLLLTPLLCWFVLHLRRLQKAGQELASGHLDYQVDIRGMTPPLKAHGMQLNSIGAGMQKAVDEQLRSERLKTELITNVSHDLKTPLTSLVNYVALLKTLDLQDETAREYIEVLDRQSARLKKLTEDLVEASKASTGNLPVQLEPTDVNVLLSQTAGEYEDKLARARLKAVVTPSPEPAFIRADGKLLWRVIDNLMSNICKYAMPDTRVYLSAAASAEQITLTFKNVSRSALNISPEELMERFVRGDASRNTEGSGLGLSIARSLTELQQGRFQLSIDGDLFRADLLFDPCEPAD